MEYKGVAKALMQLVDPVLSLLVNVLRYCTVLYCTVLYCTVLYCTVLYVLRYCTRLSLPVQKV